MENVWEGTLFMYVWYSIIYIPFMQKTNQKAPTIINLYFKFPACTYYGISYGKTTTAVKTTIFHKNNTVK